MSDQNEFRESKRRKVEGYLDREISPPPLKSKTQSTFNVTNESINTCTVKEVEPKHKSTSPFRLTSVKDLPESFNIDTITLTDILYHDNLQEAWLFNYLFDLDFTLAHLHVDVAKDVKVTIIHGSRKETPVAAHLDQWNRGSKSTEWPNVSIKCAYMPEMFGTHHSKMMILFFGDETAQIVIHTANMIPFDWKNMTNGAWLSPRLPRVAQATEYEYSSAPIGSGKRFKMDIMRYLKHYENRTIDLVSRLKTYNFDSIRAAFLGSCPGNFSSRRKVNQTSFGWPGLREILQVIPSRDWKDSQVIVQISSIASLGMKWEEEFFNNLRCQDKFEEKASVKIIFPTVDDIKDSLNGYDSGSSVHMKSASSTGLTQVSRLQSKFQQWSPGLYNGAKIKGQEWKDGLRGIAAPHIKTYVKFNKEYSKISWALLTSANLSKQAWGASINKDGNVRICSYETGVMVWPEVFEARDMIPCFGKDTENNLEENEVPLRMAYGLPLLPHVPGKHKVWSTDENHKDLDRHGNSWIVRQD